MSIPKGWEEVRLGDICDISSGGTPSKKVSEYWENGTIKWLGSTVCKNEKYINEITDYITESGLKNSSAKLYKSGTTLMALVGATIGKVAYLDFEATTNQNIAGLYPKDENVLNCEFLFYSVLMLYKYIFGQSNGNFNMANLSFVRDLTIKLPPLKEQEKIAEILSSCDEHIKTLKNLKSELEKEKLHLMNELLSGKTRFANFTTPWQEVTLADICEYKNGGAFEKFVVENGKKYLITLDSISIDGKLKKEHKMIDNVECECLKKNDIVMILSDVAHGYFLGLTGIIPCDDLYVLNQRVGLLRPSENIDAYFLSSYINNNQHYFKIQGQGSSQQNLAKGSIINFKIKLPSLEEQKKIGEVLSACDERLQCLNELITAQTTLKSHLLTELLSGNLIVKI